jgi:hypothetical protein
MFGRLVDQKLSISHHPKNKAALKGDFGWGWIEFGAKSQFQYVLRSIKTSPATFVMVE